MTEADQLAMQMELSEASRQRLARELHELRQLRAACRRHHHRLPHQVQTALRAPTPPAEIGAPAEGMPGLFSQGRTA